MKIKLFVFSILISLNMFAQDGIISEEILIKNDSISLPGTLTYNSELKSQPLVIFIHGSGNVDRNGNQAMMNANANYIKQLNDSLVSKEIAFYRFDKRTATQENLKLFIKNMHFDAFIDDVNIIVNHFKDDKRFSSITLIGHSQGSLIGMLADQEHIDKYISLAGPSNSIEHSIIAQTKLQNGDSISNLVASHFKELSEKGSIENVDPNLMALFNKPTQPFMLSWMNYDPSEEIKKLTIPILIINGDKDMQVSLQDAEKLQQSNPKAKLVIIKNMNHVLKRIENDTDNYTSYYQPDFPLSEELVAQIVAFIKK